MKIRQLTLCALLTAVALALSYIEGLLPPMGPLPGGKMGLGNVVTVFALYALGAVPAGEILLGRCLLGAVFTGNAGALLYSLLGGTAARMNQLFSRSQDRSTNVATFLALLELVRGGRVELGPKGKMTLRRGPLERKKETK